MATRIVHAVLPGNNDLSWFVSGIVVSNLALLVALSYFARLVRLDADEATASRACLYLLVFPTTFFLSAVYSESVFVSVTLAAFYHARRNQWLTAGFFGALAALSRSPGILIAVPLAVEYVAQRHFQWRKIRPDVLPLGLIPAALGGLMFYFHLRFGNMFATQDAQASWGDGWGIFRGPLYPFIQLATRPLGGHDLIDLTFALFALILSVYAAIRFRLSYGVYAVLTYLFLSSWGSFDSMPRYVLVIFPAFIALALWGRNEIFHRAYLVVASGFAVFFMMAFTLWRWVA
jgi:Gpi18-like mannosyltransferase